METREEYNSFVQDIEAFIACETSGLIGSLPEQDDRDLAEVFLMMVNHEGRHSIGREALKRRIQKVLDDTYREMLD